MEKKTWDTHDNRAGFSLRKEEVPVVLDHVEEPAGADFKRNKPDRGGRTLSELTHTQTQKQPNS